MLLLPPLFPTMLPAAATVSNDAASAVSVPHTVDVAPGDAADSVPAAGADDTTDFAFKNDISDCCRMLAGDITCVDHEMCSIKPQVPTAVVESYAQLILYTHRSSSATANIRELCLLNSVGMLD